MTIFSSISNRLRPDVLPEPEEFDAATLVTASDWIHRRVESFSLVDGAVIRRQQTVDYSVPEFFDGYPSKIVRLPIAYLRKDEPVINIDFLDASGDSVPLRTKHENGDLTVGALIKFGDLVLGPELGKCHHGDLERIALSGAPEAIADFNHLFKSLRNHRDQLPNREAETFQRKLMGLWNATFMAASNSVIWIDPNLEPGRRSLVKFSYDLRLTVPGSTTSRVSGFLFNSGIRLTFDTPHCRDTSSYHARITAPPGGAVLRDLEVVHDEPPTPEAVATLAGAMPEEPKFQVQRCVTQHRHALAYLTSSSGLFDSPDKKATFSVTVQAGRKGLLSLATLAGILMAALMWLAVIAEPGIEASSYETAATVLLVAPSILVALVIQQSEHAFTSKLISGARYLVLLQGTCTSLAAGTLAYADGPSASLRWSWIGLAIVVSLATLALSISWINGLVRRSAKSIGTAVGILGVFAPLAVVLLALDGLLGVRAAIAMCLVLVSAAFLLTVLFMRRDEDSSSSVLPTADA